MSWPSTVIVPDVGVIIRLIIRIEVVLPQPDGPTNTVNDPVRSADRGWSTARGAVRVGLRDVPNSITVGPPSGTAPIGSR